MMSETIRTADPALREIIADMDGLRVLMDERDRRYESRFQAQDEKTLYALTSSKEAVLKAEAATEKRFEGVNEFRKALTDQSATFLPRAEADAKLTALGEKVEAIRIINSERAGRSIGSASTIAMALVIASLIIGLLTLILKTKL